MCKSLLLENINGKKHLNKTWKFNLYLIRQSFKGTVVNRTLPSLHEGLFEIILALNFLTYEKKVYKVNYQLIPDLSCYDCI